MPALTCYRIRPLLDGEAITDFDVLLTEEASGRVVRSRALRRPGFTAVVYTAPTQPHIPAWAAFLQQGFSDLELGRSGSPSALLVVRIRDPRYRRRSVLFAFAFGPMGRHLLRPDAYERGYGLRASLNLMYPRGADDSARLRAVDSKRRGPTMLRSRDQSSNLADFEVFDVNRLHDVVSKAHGLPADHASWGRRIGGGDSMVLSSDITIGEIGRLCRDIELASRRIDYTDRFSWIDDLQPVTDPITRSALEDAVVADLRAGDLARVSLAPPEIVDWEQVVGFRFHYDRPQGRAHAPVVRPDLRLTDYLAGLFRTFDPGDLDAEWLRPKKVYAVDENGDSTYQWGIWRCLVAEVQLDGSTYVLDEGEFYRVSSDYVDDLNKAIDAIQPSSRAMPDTTRTTVEADYNIATAASDESLLLLDRRTVRIPARTTAIEICDLLSTDRQLIHVKRHLGSADLSHLFAQGLVSAQLLQSSTDFRRAAQEKIREVCGSKTGFTFINEEPIRTSEFEIAYAIAERWDGRTPVAAMPFFSKVNLREIATRLQAMGFLVTLSKIEAR
jgi:uncharacterized protein (TIGR04141 family)